MCVCVFEFENEKGGCTGKVEERKRKLRNSIIISKAEKL